MEPINYVTWISWIATCSSICVQLVGIQICVKFVRRGSTANVSCVPFTIAFVNACLWVRYSMLANLVAVLTVSSVSIFLQFSYIICYYQYTLHKTFLYKQVLLGVLWLFSILSYVKYYVKDETVAIMQLGLVGCFMSTVSYGAPLATLSDVLRTKCTETVSFPLVSANFVVSVLWVVYGLLIQNRHIIFPNGVGMCLCLVQLFLFICYPTSRPSKLPGSSNGDT